MKKRKRRNTKSKSIASNVFALLILGLLMLPLVDFAKYPDKYVTTWRHQLQCDIEQGNEAAIEYYETTYVANGIRLFGEE